MPEYYSVLNRNFLDLNPVCYGYETCQPGHSYGYSAREYFLIHFVLSGQGKFIVHKKTYPLSENDLFLIRPGESTFYQADHTDPWEYVWIGFDGEKSGPLLSQTLFSREEYCLYLPQARRIFEEIRRIPDRLPSTELLLCARLFELIALLMPSEKQDRPGDYARRAADYIRSNYPLPITVEGVAQMLHLNRRYLSRIFLKYYGLTPQEYLLRCRLEKAAALLKGGGCTVKEASRSVGYADSCHFSRLFKARFGVPPSRF